MYIHGEKVGINNPTDAVKHKIAYVTEDRKEEGLVLSSNIKENIVMANIEKILNKFNLISEKSEVEIAKKQVKN